MSTTIEGLIEKQLELYGRISRAVDNLKKLGVDNISRCAIESRLETLLVYWEKFQKNDDLLVYNRSTEQKGLHYFKDDVYGSCEEAYFAAKTEMKTLLLSFLKEDQDRKSALSKSISVTHHTTRSLPKLSIPKFAGEYHEWPAFRDMFKSVVDENPDLSSVEKLHYLKSYVTGEADRYISNFAVTSDNYALAWQTLINRYENKRVLVASYLDRLFAIPQISRKSVEDLKSLLATVKETLGALFTLQVPTDHWDIIIVHFVSRKLDSDSREAWELHQGNSTEPASFAALDSFLESRIRAFEAMGIKPTGTQLSKPSPSSISRSRGPARSLTTQSSEVKSCSFCGAAHYIASCPALASKSTDERRAFVVQKNLCFNCLGPHRLSECRSSKRCRHCNGKHHSLIHRPSNNSPGSSTISSGAPSDSTIVPSSPPSMTPSASTSSAQAFLGNCITSISRRSVLLATAQVFIVTDRGDQMRVRALLDQGSEISFIRESLAQALRLPRQKAAIPVHGIGSNVVGSTRGKVTLLLRSCVHRSFECNVDAYILPKLTGRIPSASLFATSWEHLRGISLADPEFTTPGNIDIILGSDIYGNLLRGSICRGSPHEPIAQDTHLGWIVSGPVSSAATCSYACGATASFSSLETNLDQMLTRFWEVEDVPSTSSAILSADDQHCESHFLATHFRDSTGRYVVRLPFQPSHLSLGDSYSAAASMLRRVQKRIEIHATYGSLYRDFMKEYEHLGHMKKISSLITNSLSPVYLPHHGVLRDSSTTTKLRVVFNGSMPTSSGISLNQCLLPGPKLQLDLANLLLRWRQYQYVFAADIEKMYRQIVVHEDDRDFQRIVWSESGDEQRYQLCTVTYGLTSAPYLALRVLRQLADDEGHRFPLAADILRREIYVDDVLSGADTLSLASEKVHQIDQLLMAGGFRLQKWVSTNSEVLQNISRDRHATQHVRNFEDSCIARTLGISWHPVRDKFIFKIQEKSMPSSVTKRAVLSRIATIFDPLGWITPLTIRAKIFMQALWKDQLEWDDPLPQPLAQDWNNLNNDFNQSNEFSIPRWIGVSSSSLAVELHGFADASTDALGAVLYLRVLRDLNDAHISLLAAKSRVAPIKRQTVPRLELCAAVLLVRLVANVQTVLSLTSLPIHLWTDSSVTLAWISASPSKWKDFVANRVAFIRGQAPSAKWHHVPGVDNPADCASRGISSACLQHHPLWWHGPAWLRRHSTSWPSDTPAFEPSVDLEQRRICSVATSSGTPVIWSLVDRYSNLRRLLRVTAWISRAISRFRGHHVTGPLTPAEIINAETFWITQTQAAYFANELKILSSKHPALGKSNPLRRLTPFLDNQGLLRVGGRLQHSLLDPDAKQPKILPRESTFTRLVIDRAHRQTLHGGTQLTLATLRRNYWIVGGRTPIQSFIRQCVTCARYRASIAQQKMGQLPSTNVLRDRPFRSSGVDYAGPFSLLAWRGRGARTYKGFLIVFVCLSTSAVHLELATDYSTQGFLQAFKRFVHRRGSCATLRSDCGKNLVGADAELRRLFSATSKQWAELSSLLANDGTKWIFNPPSAPHFGGKWEAAVKSVKFHLKRIIGDACLTYEEFSTLLTQIEAVLNSRPLCSLSDDVSDLEALTPGHFLIGEPLITLPEPSLDAENSARLSRPQLIRQYLDRFWHRWSTEYLQKLQSIYKWHDATNPVSIGSLVLIVDERYPPSKWPLARVIDIHPGADNLVRVVTVKTATSTFKRPIAKLCPLPVQSSDSKSEKTVIDKLEKV